MGGRPQLPSRPQDLLQPWSRGLPAAATAPPPPLPVRSLPRARCLRFRLPACLPASQVKKGYVGIHSSGFKDFLLKPELLRAIQDCGFEHPSEGALGWHSTLGRRRGARWRLQAPACRTRSGASLAKSGAGAALQAAGGTRLPQQH